MPLGLNSDLLHLICGLLAEEKDFRTLYNCALSSRILAVPAIANLYRIHNKAPIIAVANDDSLLAADKGEATEKLVSLWRSIILSSFDERITFDLYARSVRKLDFYELEQLMESQSFRGKSSDKFFSGEMQQFRVERSMQVLLGKTKAKHATLDVREATNRIAKFTLRKTPLLEKLGGIFSPEIIQDSLPQTERLTRLRVFDGSVLKGTGASFRMYCPHFSKIVIFGWGEEDADTHCATFLNELRPQTLRSFCMFSSSKISQKTFLALNGHNETLSQLELHSIDSTAMESLSNFRDCTNLRTLILGESGWGSVDLAKLHPEMFSILTEWLQNCKKLKTIRISNLTNATQLLTPFLRERGVAIESLELEGYQLHGSDEFHQALALQQSLKSLYLKGDESEDASDNRMLTDSLIRLPGLTDLKLTSISGGFTEFHISILADNLSGLETFWTTGYHITDSIWTDFKKLKSLKRLELNADTRFTSRGILDFVTSLDENQNKGFLLSIMMQDTDCNIAENEIENIREAITRKLDGRFDFQLTRGLEELDDSDLDSD